MSTLVSLNNISKLINLINFHEGSPGTVQTNCTHCNFAIIVRHDQDQLDDAADHNDMATDYHARIYAETSSGDEDGTPPLVIRYTDGKTVELNFLGTSMYDGIRGLDNLCAIAYDKITKTIK